MDRLILMGRGQKRDSRLNERVRRGKERDSRLNKIAWGSGIRDTAVSETQWHCKTGTECSS